jgi:hypothetical protein
MYKQIKCQVKLIIIFCKIIFMYPKSLNLFQMGQHLHSSSSSILKITKFFS